VVKSAADQPSEGKEQGLTATSTMFEWPTIELFDLKVARSMTAATNTGPFIELGVTMWVPSGDQLREDGQREQGYNDSAKAHVGLTTLVLGASSKGSATLACMRQSDVRQILRVLSSDCSKAQVSAS